ncbi:hypothetical protein BVG19_g3513 [[Candida] boidinii]|nr:hypothetical protein BVG19_g3513 [[Candida] boidinii]OWB52771.1 hypothetical protein B5S27_g4352 [[Candida] boidinii]
MGNETSKPRSGSNFTRSDTGTSIKSSRSIRSRRKDKDSSNNDNGGTEGSTQQPQMSRRNSTKSVVTQGGASIRTGGRGSSNTIEDDFNNLNINDNDEKIHQYISSHARSRSRDSSRYKNSIYENSVHSPNNNFIDTSLQNDSNVDDYNLPPSMAQVTPRMPILRNNSSMDISQEQTQQQHQQHQQQQEYHAQQSQQYTDIPLSQPHSQSYTDSQNQQIQSQHSQSTPPGTNIPAHSNYDSPNNNIPPPNSHLSIDGTLHNSNNNNTDTQMGANSSDQNGNSVNITADSGDSDSNPSVPTSITIPNQIVNSDSNTNNPGLLTPSASSFKSVSTLGSSSKMSTSSLTPTNTNFNAANSDSQSNNAFTSGTPSSPSHVINYSISSSKRELNIEDLIQRLLDAGYSGKRTKSLCLKNSEVATICATAREIFLSQPSLLELSAPVKIVGDVHGQYSDLIRIFTKCGFPPAANYLFLGDYVDRGKQSLETILLLLCYKIKYPENFFLLRGNHECAQITRAYGFYDECKRRTNLKTWKIFIDTFNALPIAAIVASKIFCVHGGLSPVLNSMDEIRKIQRPTDVPDFGLLNDLLWSDPADTSNEWEDNERGVSYCFNQVAINKFLNKFQFDLVVRAHMVVEDGYEFFNDRSLVTVFSAPNYCGEFDNWGAVMSVSEELLCSFELLDPLDSVALKQLMKKGKYERRYATLNHPSTSPNQSY